MPDLEGLLGRLIGGGVDFVVLGGICGRGARQCVDDTRWACLLSLLRREPDVAPTGLN